MNNQQPLRILILTSSTGGGHDARAQSICEWFEKLYASKVELRIENVLEKGSLTGKFGVQLYNFIQKHCPIMHCIYWLFIELAGQLNRFQLLFGRKHFRKLIDSFKPQLIISVHDFLNFGFFKEARKTLGPANVRCVTYCGEYSGGFGHSLNWIDPSVDLYFSRTRNAQLFAEKWGIPEQKSFVFFPLIPPYLHQDFIEDKESYKKNILELSKDKFTIFFATGSNGANDHIRFLNKIKHLYLNVQGIVICGNNEKVYKALLKWKQQNPLFELFLEAYSNKVHRLIQVSDVMVTKGGSNTVTKALFYKCPIIFSIRRGFMPQEWATIRYFLQHKGAACITNSNAFCKVIASWKNFEKEYSAVRSNLKNIIPESLTPESFIHKLYELGISTQ